MIYLDNNATTQVLPEVVEAMQPFWGQCYYNPSSSHAAFTGADRPREDAAVAMAQLFNAEEPECFTFTSGATEANNWVFRSVSGQRKGRVIISAIEHASVREPAQALSGESIEVVCVPVSPSGVIYLDKLEAALNEETFLVSIIAAHNETGTVQPIAEATRLVRTTTPHAIFHTDATQAVGKLAIDVKDDWADVDLISFSAHKFHGPKGVGGLYVRPGAELRPMMLGGGQEKGMRSGTTNTPGLAGLAAAARLAGHGSLEKTQSLRDAFERRLQEIQPGIVVHGQRAARLPNTSYFSIPGIRAEDVAFRLAKSGILVGTGAACSSGAIGPSATLLAMGVAFDVANAAIRVSLSRHSQKDDVEAVLALLAMLTRKEQSQTPKPQVAYDW